MSQAHNAGVDAPAILTTDAERAAVENAQLADAAMGLLRCQSSDDVYDAIGDFIELLCPNAVIIVNEATDDLGWLVTRRIRGLEGSLVARAADLFGAEIEGSRWAMLPEYQDEVLSGTLLEMPGGVAELAAREVPRALAEAGAKLSGIHGVYTIGIADGQNALGSIRILTRDARHAMPTHIIESFAHHCYSALTSIAKARDLAESVERYRAVADEVLHLNVELERRVEQRTSELVRANAELSGTNLRLEEATRAKSEFLAAMSHELRTPLNSIIGFSGVLLRGMTGSIDDEQRRQLTMINNSGRHLLELINGVLDLARIESGSDRPMFDQADIGAIAQEMCDVVRPMADAKCIELRVAIPADPTSTLTDQRYVRQILLNLLSNAVKFTEGGCICVTVSRDARETSVSVEDTGCGIAAGELARIFDDFYQATPVGVAKSMGTGLGLTVSRRLADALGGRIGVVSGFGQGSTFTLYLPIDAEGS